MKEYRTDEQFQEIVDNMVNGNWKDAAQNCVDYGFYANDLLQKCEDEEALGYGEFAVSVADLVILVEMATERRCK